MAALSHMVCLTTRSDTWRLSDMWQGGKYLNIDTISAFICSCHQRREGVHPFIFQFTVRLGLLGSLQVDDKLLLYVTDHGGCELDIYLCLWHKECKTGNSRVCSASLCAKLNTCLSNTCTVKTFRRELSLTAEHLFPTDNSHRTEDMIITTESFVEVGTK